jgi:hypothetical protein
MSEVRVFSDKVLAMFKQHLDKEGSPVLEMSIKNILDDIKKGTLPTKAIWTQSKFLRVPLFQLEDVIYEITGKRYHAKGAGCPGFKRRPYKKREKFIIDKETGEVLDGKRIFTNMIIGQDSCMELPKIMPGCEVEIKPIEPMEAQIILRRREMNDLYKLYNTHYNMGDYIVVSVQPKTITMKFLDSKYNVKMEISSEREQATTTPEVKSIKTD